MSGRGAFARLWAGQTASVFGTSISALALPTVAILSMHAPAYLVGVLEAAQFAAYPFLGLAAGVWVDRLSRPRGWSRQTPGSSRRTRRRCSPARGSPAR